MAIVALKQKALRPQAQSGTQQINPRWRGILLRVVQVMLVLSFAQALISSSRSGGGNALRRTSSYVVHIGSLAMPSGGGQQDASAGVSTNSTGSSSSSGSAQAAKAGAEEGQQKQPAAEAGGKASEQPAAEASSKASEQPAAAEPGGKASEQPAAANAGGKGVEQQHLMAAPAKAGLACEESGLCSVGKAGRYWGEITTNEQLKQMLEAVSYKKEIIMAVASTGDMPTAVNLVWGARDLGLAHFVLLMWNQSQCDAIPEAFKPALSCVWDSRRSEASAGPWFDSWAKRWEFTARALRMGYNVLAMDADTVMLDDPYRYLKSPTFANYTALFHRDGNNFNHVNCGLLYFQNCHPSGPTTFMAVELADRTLRQREDMAHMKSADAYGDKWTHEGTWEQNVWNDMLHGASQGRPVTLTPGEPVMPKDWFKENLDHTYGMRGRMQAKTVTWPEAWRQRTLYAQGPLHVVESLQYPVPPSNEWWAKNSKYFYPKQRQKSSTAFRQLALDASPLPLYEVGKPWQPPADVPQEHFAFLPAWFVSTWVYRGANGFWALQPPSQIIAHCAYSYGPDGSGLWKPYTFKGFGWWHWEVSEVFSGGLKLGIAADPKLLMLAPGVALYTDTEEAFRDTVGRLSRLAGALGRKLVVPSPPCDSPWLGVFDVERKDIMGFQPGSPEDASIPTWPDKYDGMSVLHWPDWQRRRRGAANASYCHWIRAISKDCMDVLVPQVDAQAFLDKAVPPELASPAEANTLWLAEWRAAGGEDGPASRVQEGQKKEERRDKPQPAVQVRAAVAVEAGQSLASAPVLFMGAVPLITDEEGLPPLAPSLTERCRAFQPDRQLDRLTPELSGLANRQARLSGAAAASA